MTYIVTRNVDRTECPWLERNLLKGDSIFQYGGPKKASSTNFLLCRLSLLGEPVEVPEDALIDENWLHDRPDRDANGIPILYL